MLHKQTIRLVASLHSDLVSISRHVVDVKQMLWKYVGDKTRNNIYFTLLLPGSAVTEGAQLQSLVPL